MSPPWEGGFAPRFAGGRETGAGATPGRADALATAEADATACEDIEVGVVSTTDGTGGTAPGDTMGPWAVALDITKVAALSATVLGPGARNAKK